MWKVILFFFRSYLFAQQTGLQRSQVEKEVMQLLMQLNEGGLLVITNQTDSPNVDFKKSN